MKDFSFKKLVLLLIPTRLRKKSLFVFLVSLIYPLEALKTEFFNNRQKNIDTLKLSPQVCVVEYMLNDLFDPQLRRIRAIDGEVLDWTMLWRSDQFDGIADAQTGFVDNGQALMLTSCDSITDNGSSLTYNYTSGIVMLASQGSVGSLGYDFTIEIPAELKSSDMKKKESFENQLKAVVNKNRLLSKRFNIRYYE